jgi:polyisoprenyl-phosphate glycosyltransferase
MSEKLISIIIPTFNGAKCISDTVTEIHDLLVSSGQKHEIVVVDDCSQDSVFDVVLNLKINIVRCVRLAANKGQHMAIRVGLGVCVGSAAIILADDGQDNPNVIPEMIQKWGGGKDIVWALHAKRVDTFLIKIMSLFFYSILKCLYKRRIAFDISRADFALIDRKVVDTIKTLRSKTIIMPELLAKLDFSHDFVTYERRPSGNICSRWSFFKRVKLALIWLMFVCGRESVLIESEDFLYFIEKDSADVYK